jgi:predicted MFS family arabinose efflux permease
MVRADLLAAASQAGMAFLLFRTEGSVAPLVALMAINGIAFALHWPAAVGLVPQIVPRERLQPANAFLSLAQSAATGLGGATAGVIVALAGAGWAIAADAATFAVSAWLVAGLRPRDRGRSEPSSFLHELRDGWREFTSHRWLWAIVAQFSLVVAGWSGGFLVVGPVVAERSLGGPAAWGWIAGAFGAGLLAGGVVGLRVAVRRPMLVATLCVFAFALPLATLAGPAPLWAIGAGAFAAGVGAELFSVLWNTALHTHVAPDALSRVSAWDILGSIALAPLGQALAGPAIELFGARGTLEIAVALIALPTLAVLGVREVRSLGSGPPRA